MDNNKKLQIYYTDYLTEKRERKKPRNSKCKSL